MPEISREKLYELIWTTPMVRLAPQLGVSDVAIAKACKRMNIPRPSVGFWARQKSREDYSAPPLPESNPGPRIWNIPSRRRHAPRAASGLPPDIPVATSLTEPHQLTLKTQTGLGRSKADRREVISPSGQGRLDIEVSEALTDRGLRILDALLKALEARGHKIRVGDSYEPMTLVEVNQETVRISLREKLNQSKHKMTAEEPRDVKRYGYSFAPVHDFSPSGHLRLRILGLESSGARQSWSDGKKSQLEDKLGQVVLGIEAAADAIRQDRVEAEQRRLEWEERRLREQEEEIRRSRERLRVQKLREMAADWSEANSVRAFVGHIESSARARGDIGDDLEHWLRWARAHSDRLDPTGDLFVGDSNGLVDEWKMGKVGTNPSSTQNL
jgi:hypothetical protein